MQTSTNTPIETVNQTVQTTQASEATKTMQAATRREYGSADKVAVETIDRPVIAEDEVLVEVVAAGLDRGVWHLMTGTPYLIRLMGFGLTKPKQPVLGMDVAGRVAAIGENVTRFAIGDEVFGIADGSFAQYAAAKEAKLVHKPANVSFEQAAAATISGITALQALTTVGKVQPGQHVLVIGASGGVGSFAVQLAKALGASVTGVASGAKLDAVRALGADHVVDYTTTRVDETDRRYDLIIDIGGRNPISRLRRALTPTGTLVMTGGEGGDRWTGGFGRQLRAAAVSMFVSQRLVFFISEESLDYIEPLAGHLADASVVPMVVLQVTLDEVPRAMAAMEAGELTAKAVIKVQP